MMSVVAYSLATDYQSHMFVDTAAELGRAPAAAKVTPQISGNRNFLDPATQKLLGLRLSAIKMKSGIRGGGEPTTYIW